MYQQEQSVIMPIIKSRKRTVGEVIPRIFPLLLAVFQMILWLAIIGLESASVYYDAGRGTIYAGFWCSIIFFITWIAMFSFVCCNKSTGCGIYLIVQNIINLIFAIILIIYTARFINDVCLCYGILCEIPPWDQISELINYPNRQRNCTDRTDRKLPVLKGLLSCAVLMLVSNLIFIVVYLIAYIRLRGKSVSASRNQSRVVTLYQSPSNPYHQPYLSQNISQPHYYYSSQGEIISTDELASTPAEVRVCRF